MSQRFLSDPAHRPGWRSGVEEEGMREQGEATCVVHSVADCGVTNGALFRPSLHLLSQFFKLLNHTFKLIPSHNHGPDRI